MAGPWRGPFRFIGSFPRGHPPDALLLTHLRGRPGVPLLSPSADLKARGERREVVDLLHTRGGPWGIEVTAGGAFTPEIRLICPEGSATFLKRVLLPHCGAWFWERVPASELRPGAVGVLESRTHYRMDVPVRGIDPQDGRPEPWLSWVRAVSREPSPWTLRWIFHPVGPSHPAFRGRQGPLPREDRKTPLPVPATNPLARDLEEVSEEKALGPHWSAVGIIVGGSRDHPAEPMEAMARLLAQISSHPGGGGVRVRWIRRRREAERVCQRARELGMPPTSFGHPPLTLGSPEVMAWLPPSTGNWNGVPAPDAMPGNVGIRLGSSPTGDPVRWEVAGWEGHHLIITGETGMGKSSLLRAIFRQSAARDWALVVLDPIGDFVTGLLRELPPGRRAHAVLVDPVRSPVGVNPLLSAGSRDPAASPRAERQARVQELVSALHRVRAERFDEVVFWGPRLEDVLGRVLNLASWVPGGTLRDALAVLEDPAEFSGLCGDTLGGMPEPRALLASLREEPPDALEGARRVLRELMLSDGIARILCHPSPTWDLGRALERGSTTFLSLARGKVGTRPSAYLGSLLLALLWSAVQRRGSGPKVLLFLDEVQEYVNDALLDLLRLGRRHNIHVIMTTQSLAAVPAPLRETVWTNVRDFVCFRGAGMEAEASAKMFGLDGPSRLAALPSHVAIAFLGKGTRQVPLRPESAWEGGSSLVPTPEPWDIAEGSRKHWSPDLWGPQAPGAPDPPPLEGRDEGLRAVWEAIRCGLDEPVGSEVKRLPLSRVRDLLGERTEDVRELGRRLHAAGILVRTEGSGPRRIWWVKHEPLPGTLPPVPEGPPLAPDDTFKDT